MDATLEQLFNNDFMPHGQCYLWQPGLVWLHVISDALIGIAYIVIPITLLHVVRQRDDLPFSWMFVLFGIFIVACGATHFVEVWNVWNSNYWFSGSVKLVTAAASIPTAILLIYLIPRIQSIPSRNELARANRQLEDVVGELEQFTYAVSHDLRAPLRSMEGFGGALQKRYADKLDEQGRHYLERIQAGSRRMGELIDDLLMLSRLQQEDMTQVAVDISKIAAEIMEELREHQPDREVEVEIEPGIQVRGDPKLLRIVMQNLLSNAWKFTRDRSPAHIEVGTRSSKIGQVVYVSDNGAGFDTQYADKLFSPFQRLHREDEFEGTGIGLATVQRIVRKHGGDLWADGRVDAGATFHFSTA